MDIKDIVRWSIAIVTKLISLEHYC